MIPYKLPEEKDTLLFYSDLFDDTEVKKIIKQDCFKSSDEAEKFADFFWRAVTESNKQDKLRGGNSEYIFEKIIITLMAYYRASGYENIWEEVSDRN